MWVTMATVAAVALCIGVYLAIGAMRHGASLGEVLPPAILLSFGIALAAGLLLLEGWLVPDLQWHVAGTTQFITIGIPSIISIAICMGIAKVWGRLFGPAKGKADLE
jgi:hypothetical protein